MKLAVALVASLLAIAGNLPYLWDIFKGRVQPHAYTWFVWTLVSGIVFFGQVAKGAGVGAIPTAASEIFTLIIFLYSLKNGFREVTWSDHASLAAALFGIGLWALTADPTWSVVIAVCIDLTAFIPTLRKTWRYPSTETPTLYGSNVLRHALALFSLQAYNIATTLHSIAMILANSAMTLIIVSRQSRRRG